MDDIIKYFRYAIMFPLIMTLIVSIIIIPILIDSGYNVVCNNISYLEEKKEFLWPTPNFTQISSKFGWRKSPTAGASSYHSGIDILAYQGSKILSIQDGKVIFAGWSSTGGYMVKINHANNLQSVYCHMAENLYVRKGDNVQKGQIIGTVGPKYLSNGKLNGATTGVHLHLAIYENEKAVNPLKFFEL